jgi:uncharacterized membrane-anchored protein YitT (DUF2179 family)
MTTQQLLVPSNATLKRNVMDYSLIVVGSFLQALSYVLFLAPYKIVPGGVYGISIVIHYVTKDLFPFFPDGLPMGATALCFNIPLMILAMKKIGLSSGPKTIVTFLLISIFTDSFTKLTTYLNLDISVIPIAIKKPQIRTSKAFQFLNVC